MIKVPNGRWTNTLHTGVYYVATPRYRLVGRTIEVVQTAGNDLDTDSSDRDQDANGRAIPDCIICEDEKIQGYAE